MGECGHDHFGWPWWCTRPLWHTGPCALHRRWWRPGRRTVRIDALLDHRYKQMTMLGRGIAVLHYSTCPCGRGMAMLVGEREIEHFLEGTR